MRRIIIISVALAIFIVGFAVSSHADSIALQIANPGGPATSRWPVTTGVPFREGVLKSAANVRLLDAQGREVPLQATVTATHRDGSVRWLLLDFQSDIPAAGRKLTLEYGPNVKAAAIAGPLQVTEKPESIGINTGPLQVSFDRKRCDGLSTATLSGKSLLLPGHKGGAYFVSDDGQVFRACGDQKPSVQIESQGPLRTVVTTRGWYVSDGGDRKCQFTIRYHFFAGQPTMKIMYTWLMTEDSSKLRFRDIGFTIPMASSENTVWFEDGSSQRAQAVVQHDFDKHKLLGKSGSSQSQPLGLMTTSGPTGGCSVVVRDFRQLFPKELSAGPEGVTFHVWPAHGVKNPERKVEDANLQYIWYAHEGEVLDFQAPEAYYNHQEGLDENSYRYLRSSKNANGMGLAKTHELWVSFRPAGAAADPLVARVVQNQPACLADPQWMCVSGVFGAMQPYSPDQFGKYEKLISDNFDAEQRMQAFTRDYGMWNFGDSHTSWDMAKGRWSDAYRTWRNTHHGAPRVPWLLYVRSGDPKYLKYALRNTQHILDVDYCHYSTPEFEALEYPRGKLKGALNDYKGIVHWHSGNRLMDYNSMTDFALWYWHMTGDRWGLEVAQDWGEAVRAKFTAPFGSRSGTGTMSALIDLYADTGDESYRPIIEAFFTHLTTKVQNVDGTVKYSAHVLAYWPQHRDKITPLGSFPEWENYAPWIERYWDLTHSEAAKKALVAWADSYLEGYGDMSSLWGTREYMNILAYAYLVTRDPKYLGRGVWELDKAVASVYQGEDPLLQGFMQSGQVSLGGYIIQRLPAFMKALAVYGKPVEPDALLAWSPGFQLMFERTRPTINGKPMKIETTRFAVFEQQDQEFAITLHTNHTYEQRTFAITVLKPNGEQAAKTEETYPKGAKDLIVKVPADAQTGAYRVEVAAEGSMGRVADPIEVTPALPVAFPVAGQLVSFTQSRYYLYVPHGAKEVKVEFTPINGGDATCQARPVKGDQRVLSVTANGKSTLTLKPTAEQTGQCWELLLAGGSATMSLTVDGKPTAQVLLQEAYPPGVCEALLGALAAK
ncbi:MAG: exo-rhamnogalacturonan lyase family protein [Armatimonadota bacterium]